MNYCLSRSENGSNIQSIVKSVVSGSSESNGFAGTVTFSSTTGKATDVAKILQLVKKVVDMYVKQSHISMLQV